MKHDELWGVRARAAAIDAVKVHEPRRQDGIDRLEDDPAPQDEIRVEATRSALSFALEEDESLRTLARSAEEYGHWRTTAKVLHEVGLVDLAQRADRRADEAWTSIPRSGKDIDTRRLAAVSELLRKSAEESPNRKSH